jgi:hypothetical protein
MVEEVILIETKNTITLKKAIANKLYKNKLDQSKISEILQLSQPMVSHYLKSKEQIPKKTDKLAEKISNKILNNKNTIFHTCITFSEKPIEGNYYIGNENEIINDENNKIIENLTEAFWQIKGKNITGLIPEIKINMAMAKKNAKTIDDIAAFLNGLIIADDKITGNNGIRFGRSKHLSNLILYLKNKKINVNAVMNTAYIHDVEKTGLKYSYLDKDFKLTGKTKNVDILLHKGDFGIEPCSYILGENAVDVVNKTLKIWEKIK